MIKIKLANIIFKINNMFPFVEKLCSSYLEDPSSSYDEEISPTIEEVKEEYRISEYKDGPKGYYESIVIYRLIALRLYKYKAFVLHGAVIKVDEDGFIFLAKSGVGKSTHISLYQKHFKERCVVINGDKPLIKEEEDGFYAYGTPYNGKEGLGINDRVKIKGLCFLKRGLINKTYPMSEEDISTYIFNQILLPKNEEDYDILISLLNKIILDIKTIWLECNMEEEACKVSYKALGGMHYEN